PSRYDRHLRQGRLRGVAYGGSAVAGGCPMTNLAAAVQEYLALRRSLGYKLYLASLWLRDFASFLDTQGSSVITTELALKWARLPADASPSYWAHRLSVVRQFARHHRVFDARTEVPPTELIPYRMQR